MVGSVMIDLPHPDPRAPQGWADAAAGRGGISAHPGQCGLVSLINCGARALSPGFLVEG